MWEFGRGGTAFTDQAGIANVESQYLKATALCVVLHPEKNLVLSLLGSEMGGRKWGCQGTGVGTAVFRKRGCLIYPWDG